jgi:endonuclease/exonuclease/phosphatase family metal-dependent hydrolase
MIKYFITSTFCLLLLAYSQAQTFNVVSYNIRYDNPDDGANKWKLRKESVAQNIFQPENEIIGLQEVLNSQMFFLQQCPQASEYDSWGYGRDDGLYEGEYAPIFFNKNKFTRYEGRMKWLSTTPDTPSFGWDAACRRIVTIARLLCKYNGKRVTVLNTHFDHQGKVARENSVKIIIDLIKKYEANGDVVIVLGDFNTKPSDPILKPLKKTVMDACPRKMKRKSTFNAFQEKAIRRKHIDYILFSKGDFKASNYVIEKPKTPQGLQASDHYLVKVKLTFL